MKHVPVPALVELSRRVCFAAALCCVAVAGCDTATPDDLGDDQDAALAQDAALEADEDAVDRSYLLAEFKQADGNTIRFWADPTDESLSITQMGPIDTGKPIFADEDDAVLSILEKYLVVAAHSDTRLPVPAALVEYDRDTDGEGLTVGMEKVHALAEPVAVEMTQFRAEGTTNGCNGLGFDSNFDFQYSALDWNRSYYSQSARAHYAKGRACNMSPPSQGGTIRLEVAHQTPASTAASTSGTFRATAGSTCRPTGTDTFPRAASRRAAGSSTATSTEQTPCTWAAGSPRAAIRSRPWDREAGWQ